jgi:hypothetical protein
MDQNNQELMSKAKRNRSQKELKQQRIDELLNSCKDEVLKQIIGPFGLTTVMFNDKDGGNVTTLHNFEKGVVATDDDQARYNEWQRIVNPSESDYKYATRKNGKIEKISPIKQDRQTHHDILKDEWKEKQYKQMSEGESVIDGYTNKELGIKSVNQIDKNNSIDGEHITSVAEIEKDSKNHLFATGENANERKQDRANISGNETNLTLIDGGMNNSKSDQDLMEWANAPISKKHAQETGNPNMTNAEYYELHPELAEKAYQESKEHIQYEQRKKQVLKQGKELLQTGAEEAGRNALRQAMGLILHEFVNSSFIEAKRIANDATLKENFLDHLIEAIKNIIEKIKDKAENIFKSALSGGVQGFIGNLLTYIINNIVTTSAKIVTIIRESLKGLWDAFKLIINPPEGMSGIEVARQATKIIAAVVTTSLGMVFEKSIEGFILSIPLLAPLAPILSPVLTGLLTGIATALIVFGIDKLFDWLNESGTQMLNAQIEHMEANVELVENMVQFLSSQFNNSKQYQLCIAEYNQIELSLSESEICLGNALAYSERAILTRTNTLQMMDKGLRDFKYMDDELEELLISYEQNKGKISHE